MNSLLALVSDDLRDSVAQCAAAAGYQMIDADVASCGRAWRSSRAVIVDPVNILALESRSMPRRDLVVLVARSAEPAGVWRAGVALGVSAAFELPDDEPALVRHLSQSQRASAGPGSVVAILGAHGGAGATVLAAATAIVAGDERHALLVDADELGAGIDLTLGVEDHPGLRWPDLTASTGQIGTTALHDALPTAGQRLSVLTGRRDDRRPIESSTLSAVVDAGRTAGDVVVVDVSRADTEVTRTALVGADVVILVLTASVASVASARAVRTRLLDAAPVVELAVRGPALSGLRAADVADAVGLRLLTAYRPDPRLASRLETSPLSRLMRKPLRRAAIDVVGRVLRARPVAS